MGKGKKKASSASSGDHKAVRAGVEAAVNEAVNIQDSAGGLPVAQASAALEGAAQRYREALTRLPKHAEAGYNLATCLSELADLKNDAREQVALMRESRTLLESVIEADTSGRGATTALAHHALGNVICAMVGLFREHCPMVSAQPCGDCCIGCPSAMACKGELAQACRHLEAAVAITERLQNQTQSGEMEEILVHWGDTLASMMQIVMDIASAERTGAGQPPFSSSGHVQEALGLCSDACSKYSRALASDTSSGDSDTDILRVKAGTVTGLVVLLLPRTFTPMLVGVVADVGFAPDPLIATGEQAVGVLLGLDGENVGGLLAKGDLCRLRARVSMLSGAGMQEEGPRREESVAWFARAVGGSPQDAEALTTAGEGLLEYGRRLMTVFKEAAMAVQGGYGAPTLPAPHVEGMRMSAVSRLQEAGNLLSRACSVDTSDADSAYNAACAFALSGDQASCFLAFTEYCRRLTLALSTSAAPSSSPCSSNKRDAARWSLREASHDADLEGVRGSVWFTDLLQVTDATLAGTCLD
ncbi:unnamed protein product [Scytosiphon promiscuus]